jgi:hypothetical protein
MQRFADSSLPTDADLPMDVEELLEYLRNLDYDAFYPMEGIISQTEAIGDPALPTAKQQAVLNWLDATMRDWDQSFQLEEPLATEMRRLRSLVAAQAVLESSFFTPGAHPLHQLLDTVQAYAIGWQASLGRVGRAVEEDVRDAVSAALVWFDSPATDLAAISADMAARAAKAAARAQKMTQRLIETERGRIRVAESKQQAALMINAALGDFHAPRGIGDFLKGSWYDSAQLVLMKYGEKSDEWKQMSLTTARILESLQNLKGKGGGEDGGRKRSFELAAQLPNELVRWLLSLQHDADAVSHALASVESFHIQVMRGEALELEKVSAIPLQHSRRGGPVVDNTVNQFDEGQWFVLNVDENPSLRAMLALRLESEQQLIFANQAGVKALNRSFSEFAQLMAEGRVTPLDSSASFSRCLARSAGVETQDDLDELTGVTAQRARLKEEERQKAERERLRLERKHAERERLELERRLREQEEIEKVQREMDEAARLQREYKKAEQLKREQLEQERLQLVREREETKRLQEKWTNISRQFFERTEAERQLPEQTKTGGAEEQAEGAELNIPRCTWLGFRDGDGEELILARLAVYNRQKNDYIFVDRHGMKVRQLSAKELLIIMTRGLTDILEARSRFKDEVIQAQLAARFQVKK